MKARYRLTRRGSRGDTFYCKDTTTGHRVSLKTSDVGEAQRIINAKNEAERQPMLNFQLAKAYLLGSDSAIARRTWWDASLRSRKRNSAPMDRWLTAQKDKACQPLWPRRIIETQGEELLKCIRAGCTSTNNHLRRLHNFCVDMNWLPWPLIPKRQWPAVRYKERRAITWDEHSRIVAREGNAERKGLLPTRVASGGLPRRSAALHGEDVDWASGTITYVRMKTKCRENQTPLQIRFVQSVADILNTAPVIPLPVSGTG